ncbi:MAG: methylenetetrahydrofolate reductase, partial [Dehalococcoidales bacterium]
MVTPFKEVLNSGKFIITSEIGPPKGTNLEKTLNHIDLLKDRVDALNATDNQSSVMRYPSLGLCLLIRERGGEPILQMTCRDRNRLALEADLLFACSRDIKTVLCLTGDSMVVGDHKGAKQVFDLDSVQLLRAIRTMESGKDLGGNDLDGDFELCAGAIVTPEAHPIEPQLHKFKKKVTVGAEFFQTQAVYDMENLKHFMKDARQYNTKILAGIV